MIIKIGRNLLLISLFLMVTSSSIAYWYLSSWKEELIKKSDAVAVSTLTAIYDSAIDNLHMDLKSLASAINPQGELSTPYLVKIKNSKSSYIDVFLASQQGQVWAASAAGEVLNFNPKILRREWFTQIIENDAASYISEPYVGKYGDVNITASAAIRTADGEVLVLGVDVELSSLMPAVSLEFAITDTSGAVLLVDHINASWFQKNIYDIRPIYKDVNLEPLLYQNPAEDWFSVSKTALNDGNILWSIVPQNQSIKTANAFIYSSVAGTIFISVLFILGVWITLKIELKNLPLVVSTIKKMSEGNFSKLDIPESKNELDDIAHSLSRLQNNVFESIESSHQIMVELLDNQVIISDLSQLNTSNAEREQSEVDQVATAATELSAAAGEVALNATHAERATVLAMDVISASADILTRSDAIATKVSESMQESSIIVNDLRDYSQNISSVIDVINGISNQINLLALNAAIEAARAGEHGRGFAVVADEVRSLASKTQQATVTIQENITRLQEQSQMADDFMKRSSELIGHSQEMSNSLSGSFNTIKSTVSEISDINSMVAAASEEQSIVTQNISERLEEIHLMVQNNLDNIQQTAIASDEISSLSGKLKVHFSFFKL